jgi:hypothetical protein
MPPKTTFLRQILKIVPCQYQPPQECLHYTQDYLKLESVLQLKKQSWELLWHKSTKMESERASFKRITNTETELYIHFLWGEILKADANRLRVIIEYIRD